MHERTYHKLGKTNSKYLREVCIHPLASVEVNVTMKRSFVQLHADLANTRALFAHHTKMHKESSHYA
jgi:hypothetical protein